MEANKEQQKLMIEATSNEKEIKAACKSWLMSLFKQGKEEE